MNMVELDHTLVLSIVNFVLLLKVWSNTASIGVDTDSTSESVHRIEDGLYNLRIKNDFMDESVHRIEDGLHNLRIKNDFMDEKINKIKSAQHQETIVINGDEYKKCN